MDAVVRNYNEKVRELTLRVGHHDWTVALFKIDYCSLLDARRFKAMFRDRHNKTIFGC